MLDWILCTCANVRTLRCSHCCLCVFCVCVFFVHSHHSYTIIVVVAVWVHKNLNYMFTLIVLSSVLSRALCATLRHTQIYLQPENKKLTDALKELKELKEFRIKYETIHKVKQPHRKALFLCCCCFLSSSCVELRFHRDEKGMNRPIRLHMQVQTIQSHSIQPETHTHTHTAQQWTTTKPIVDNLLCIFSFKCFEHILLHLLEVWCTGAMYGFGNAIKKNGTANKPNPKKKLRRTLKSKTQCQQTVAISFGWKMHSISYTHQHTTNISMTSSHRHFNKCVWNVIIPEEEHAKYLP